MRLKWTKAEHAYFSKPIPTAQRNNDWVMWFLVAILSLAGIGYFIWWMVR